MSIPFWDPVEAGYEEDRERNTNPWDILRLNHFTMPGIATVKVTPKLVIDVRKATSLDGGPTIVRGHQAAQVDIRLVVWTPAQWRTLQTLLNDLWRRPGQKGKNEGKGIDISHPACALFGITSVLIESPSSPEPASERGAMALTLKCVQYIPRSDKDVTSKTKGSGPALAQELGGKEPKNASPPRKTPAQTQATARPRVAPDVGSE